MDNLLEYGTWAEVRAWVRSNKDAIELADASIAIEVKSTDGDAARLAS